MIRLGRGYLHNQTLSNNSAMTFDSLLKVGAISGQFEALSTMVNAWTSLLTFFPTTLKYTFHGPIMSTCTVWNGGTEDSALSGRGTFPYFFTPVIFHFWHTEHLFICFFIYLPAPGQSKCCWAVLEVLSAPECCSISWYHCIIGVRHDFGTYIFPFTVQRSWPCLLIF